MPQSQIRTMEEALREVDRLEREIACERMINEQLRGLRPVSRPNWGLWVIAAACTLFWLYVLSPIIGFLG